MNKTIKIILNYVLGPILLVVIGASIYKQIINQPDLALRWHEIKTSWNTPAFWLAVSLIFVNWGIEARKWQILVGHLQPFSLWQAFKSVMAGCSVTMLTPNRIGEFGGRMLFVNEKNRVASIPLTFVGSIAQTIITFLMGLLGIAWFAVYKNELEKIFPGFTGFTINILVALSIIILAGMVLVYVNVSWLAGLLLKLKVPVKHVKMVIAIRQINGKELLRICWLSFLRYLIFILQFVLLLASMQVNIPVFLSFWLLSVFYLLLALAPSIGFTELPIRSLAGLELLGNYSDNIVGIQSATLTIWLLNLVIPAIVGSIMISGIKIWTGKNDKKELA